MGWGGELNRGVVSIGQHERIVKDATSVNSGISNYWGVCRGGDEMLVSILKM